MGHFTRLALVYAALAMLGLGLLSAGPSSSADFTIDAIADAGDASPGDGYCDSILAGFDCTLRAAIQEANALAGPDTIFIPNLFLVMNLVGSDDAAIAGDLDITDDLEITGSLFTTLMPTHGEPVFQVHGGTFRLTDLTLMDGGIDTKVSTQLEVVDVDLDAGIVNRGRGRLLRTSIVGSQRTPVTNEGVLSISETSISGNSPPLDLHAGIDNSGVLIVDRSFFDSNLGGFSGTAGLMNRAGGAALVSNSFFTGLDSLSDGGGFINEGWMRFSHVTVVGGCVACNAMISNTGGMEMQNSRFLDYADVHPICSGTPITSRGYNTVEDGSCIAVLGPGDAENSTAHQDRVPAELCAPLTLEGITRPAGETCDSGAADSGHAAFACSNGLDDDGDGFVDLQDPGCRDADDPLETHIRSGDYLLANFDTGGVSVFDPVTTRLAPITRASGLVNSYGIDVDPSGDPLVADYGLGSLTRIDAESGAASLISAGGSLVTPNGVAIESADDVFVTDATADEILVIDRATGVQTLVSNDPAFVGTDSLLLDPSDGSLLVSDIFNGIFRVTDPLGSPSVIPFAATTVLDRPRQIAFDTSGDLVIADEDLDAPVRLDPDTGVDSQMLSTTPFSFMWGAAGEPSGLSLFSDYDTGEIQRVSEANDTATVLNSGRLEPGLSHIAAVPTPAEVTLTLSDALVVDGGTAGVADIGDTLELTAVVTNVDTSPATLLSLESGLDPNLTLVASSLSTTQGTIVEGSLASDPRLEVDLGSLAPAATATVTWEVDVSDPAPDRKVTANAWVRREKVILAESDDPTTGPLGDANVIGVGDYGIVVQAVQKISDTRGELSGPGNPGAVLAQNDFFGGSLEPIGDIDGDGVEDVAVGAYYGSEGGGVGYGAFHIVLLNSDGTAKQQFKWHAASSDLAAALATAGLTLGDDNFGTRIAYLGDLDGAGPSDFALAVSAWYDDGGGTERGAVYILFMDQSPLQVLSITKIGDGVGGFPSGQLSDYDYFGNDLENAGDIDGDGVVDLAVGAHLDDTIGTNSGGVWILFLNSNGTVKASPPVQILVAPAAAGDYFGIGVASLGLFDGDAVPDLAVGATRRDVGGTDRGAVWILTLNANGTIKTQSEISPGVGGLPVGLLEDDDRFGRDVEALPDLDGDGTLELVVAASRDGDIADKAGAVYALFLTPAGATDQVVRLAPELGVLENELDEDDRLGFSVAPLGDLDSDGDLEIAIGALLDDDAATNTGAVYVLHTATPVPEPSGLLGLGSGIAFLATIGRRRIVRQGANGSRGAGVASPPGSECAGETPSIAVLRTSGPRRGDT